MRGLASALLVLLLSGSAWSLAQGTNPARDLRELQRAADAGERVMVIVELSLDTLPEGNLSPAAVGIQRAAIARAQDNLLQSLAPQNTAVGHRFDTVPFVALRVDGPALRALQTDPRVLSIQEDERWTLSLAESVPLIGAPVSLDSNSTADGHGYAIAIIDTGVTASHPFLAGKVVAEACYSNAGGFDTVSSLCPGGVGASTAPGSGADCTTHGGCGHGTHVAGIAAGLQHSGQANGPFDGVARGADLIAINVFTNFGGELGAYTSDIIKGLEFVYSLRDSHAIASVNLSLGGGQRFSSACDIGNSAFKGVVDNLRAARIATIAAAGNDGSTAGISSPACISSVISVGSTTKSDGVSSFSNSAPILDLWAPGSAIRSSIPSSSYAIYSGTSMATPHVAGAWAIMRQAYPGESVAAILTRLQQAGKPITDTRSGASNLVRPRLELRNAVVIASAQIEARVTLSVDGACSNVDLLRVAAGAIVTACFTITNRGSLSLNAHTLTSNVLTIPFSSSQSLAPLQSLSHQVNFTASASQTVSSNWVSGNGSESANATAVANVVVLPVDYLRSPQLAIDNPAGSGVLLQDDLVIAESGTIESLAVYLLAEHTWVGDLEARLTHVGSGVSVNLFGTLQNWDYCSGQNVDATFSSNAPRDPYAACPGDGGLVAGPYRSDSDLSAFNQLQGTWRLTLTDTYPGSDAGVWLAWGLKVTLTSAEPPPPPTPTTALVPTATTCSETPLGLTCSVTLSLSEHSGTSFALQADFAAPEFTLLSASDGALLQGCSVSAGETRVAAICVDGFSGSGEALHLTLQRDAGLSATFTTSDAKLVRAGEVEETIAGGSLTVPFLTCAVGNYADYPFGDVNGSRSINVTDALMVLQMAVGNITPDAYQSYHADQNSSGGINVTDALITLRKAVDSTRPAQLEAWPLTLQLPPNQGACVLIGNSGMLPLPAITVIAPSGLVVTNLTRIDAVGLVFHVFDSSGLGGTIIFEGGDAGSRSVVVTVE